MNRDFTEPAETFGLVACGSSGRWDVSVDAARDRDEWWMEIDGPDTYLVFQLRDLGAVAEAAAYLRTEPELVPGGRAKVNEERLALGRFGSASVSLVWDDEDFLRCFLVVGPNARSTFRVSLAAEDIHALVDALGQAAKDLDDGRAAG
jgi:hypothetical protein